MNKYKILKLSIGRCILTIVVGLFCVILVGTWIVLPNCMPDPMLRLLEQTPTRVYYDCHGKVLQYERTYDYQWREPVPLKKISPYFLDALISVEDAGFWRHGGVSYCSILRAFMGNVTHLRRRSGASTITMQLVSLPEAGQRKDMLGKVIQASLARKMERLYSKHLILEEYANRIPFGGKIYGIESAARFYFDKSAAELNIAEASLLAGIPQRPNALRPDLHFEAAKIRQAQVLYRMVKEGKLVASDYKKVLNAPLYLRSNGASSYYSRHYSPELEMLLRPAKQQCGKAFQVKTSLNMEFQQMLEEQLRLHVRKIPDVKDGAAVLMNARTGQVLAMVGTLNFNDVIDGQVNAAMTCRSAGSTLKPFIYAEAIDGGVICESSKVMDAPVHYGGYAPGNCGGDYRGEVTATQALAHSLNTPVIRLLAKLGPERMVERFAELNLVSADAKKKKILVREKGLTLALGTIGHSLLQLVSAYTCLADNGVFHEPSFLVDENLKERAVFTRPCAYMVGRMLRSLQIPGSTLDVAWKTGTSNGLRDAWCIAYTNDYVLGIWFGNKSGKASSYLVGGKVAAPCASSIMSALYANKNIVWTGPEECLAMKELCKKSGMAPSLNCIKKQSAWVLPGFALPVCDMCNMEKKGKITVHSPKETEYLAEKDGTDVPFQCDGDVVWYVDGTYVGTIKNGASMLFPPGRHKVIAVSVLDGLEAKSVVFLVKR